jgi:hypothetical protein
VIWPGRRQAAARPARKEVAVKRSIIGFLAAVLIPSFGFAVRNVVPVAGHLPGANQTAWTTDLMLFNSLPQSEAVTLVFYPVGAERVSRTLSLDPRESRLLIDVVNPASFPGDHPASWIGQLEVVAEGGVYVQARVFTEAEPGSGTYGSSFPVLGPAAMLERGLIPGLVQNDQYRTNVAFVNPSAMTIEFVIVIRDADGSIVASDQIPVSSHQTHQIPLSSLTSASGEGYSLEWTSPDWDAYVVASVVDNLSGDPTGIGSVALGTSSMFFPIVGKTVGAFGTNWATSLVITSDSFFPGKVTLELEDNQLGPTAMTLPIAAHASLTVADLYELFDLPSGTGFLTVTSTVPIAGHARVFNAVDGRTYGSLIRSQDVDSVSGFLHIRGVRISEDYRFNVAISNRSFTEVPGLIRVYDRRRELIYSESIGLPARKTTQFSIPQAVLVSAGELVVQHAPSRILSAVGSNVDNRTGDTVIIEGRE